MSIINNGLLLASGADAATTYQISRSLRFNSADSPRLARTPGSAGNRKTWTLSCWVKRSKIGSGQQIFSAWSGSGTTQKFSLAFYSDDKLNLAEGSGVQERRRTTQVFRDVGAWFHLVVVADTTLATANDRYKIYVNGSQITTFDITNNPAQNDDTAINQAAEHVFGCQVYGSGLYNDFYDGYLADIYLLDGTATDPSTFAQTDAVTGQWVPKTPASISYGTNGFRLSFSDNSGATSTTLGKDSAGSNNWSCNNFSVASGSGNDSLVDSPTSYGTDDSLGGSVRGNYALWNPLANSSTLTNGNLDCANGAASWQTALSTIAVSSGKWFAELTLTTHSVTNAGIHFGIAATSYSPAAGNYLGNTSTSYAYRSVVGEATGSKVNSNSFTSYGAVSTQGDVVGLALDLDAGTLTFYKNGVSQGQAFSGISGTFAVALSVYNAAGSINFGQRPFAYPVSSFKALCDTNLTSPTIAKPSTVFDVKLWTGTGSSRSITGYGFSPDFVWIKKRDTSTNGDHELFDVIRGTGKYLNSNSTGAEGTDNQTLTAFNSDGFSLGTNSFVNFNGNTFVGWAWDAGTSTVTNNNGSISSQVRANASAGFSVVSVPGYTYPTKTAGHGLGVEPHFIITKNRGVSNPWMIYHKAAGANTYFQFDTGAGYTGVPGVWSGVSSTVFPINSGINQQTDIIAYCFAPVAGLSSFGSYTGNGSTDGPFVYTGFKVKWLMIKRTDSNSNWYMIDASRSPYNEVNDLLYAEQSLAETVDDGNNGIDFLSNGFKLRKGVGGTNVNGSTLIYAAFAENPFAYARAR